MIFKVVKDTKAIKPPNKKTQNKEKRDNSKDENDKILNKKRKKSKKEKSNDSINNINEKQTNLNDPRNIKNYLKLTDDSHSFFSFNNTFCVFNSIDNILYLVYSNKLSIISYNLFEQKKMIEIKGASTYNYFITNLIHHLDIENRRDLLMSITSWGSNIKIWNIENWECLCSINKAYYNGILYSACFLDFYNEIYIITSNNHKSYYDYDDFSGPIKVYDLKGNEFLELNDSKECTFFIDIYYDNNAKKNYIITCNKSCVKSYDFLENKLYHKYSNNGHFKSDYHYCCEINKNNQLIEASTKGFIRIWDFHSGKLKQKIQLNKRCKLFCLCLWDDNHIFVGCEDSKIKLVDLKTGKVVNNLEGHYKYVLSIKKIIHPRYGECLISQGYGDDQIQLNIKSDD